MNMMTVLAHQIDDWLDFGINPIIVILSFPGIMLCGGIIAKIIVFRRTYRCTECGEIFNPSFFKTHVGVHDIDGWYQYCPKCRKITWCKYE